MCKVQCAQFFRRAHFCKNTGERRAQYLSVRKNLLDFSCLLSTVDSTRRTTKIRFIRIGLESLVVQINQGKRVTRADHGCTCLVEKWCCSELQWRIKLINNTAVHCSGESSVEKRGGGESCLEKTRQLTELRLRVNHSKWTRRAVVQELLNQ